MRSALIAVLLLIASCGGDDDTSDACQDRADECGVTLSFETGCGVADRRACILAADTCEAARRCGMGPTPDAAPTD